METLNYKDSDLRIAGAVEEESMFQNKVFKKYQLPLAVMGVGLFLGGSIALGVLGGVLAGLGTKMGMDRLKESGPAYYNWVLDNPGWIEIGSMVAFAGAFGFTLGGVFIGLVANFTTSYALDSYAANGRVEGVEKVTLSMIIKNIIAYFKSTFITIKREVSTGIKEMKKTTVEAEIIQPLAA